MERKPFLITDGDEWMRVDGAELEALLNAKLVHPCTGGCPEFTFHPVETMLKVTRALCPHDWQEQPGEPPIDVCSSCGEVRR